MFETGEVVAKAFSGEVDAGSSWKMRPNKDLEHFPTKWIPVRPKKMRQTKDLERRDDGIGSPL